MKRLIVVPVLLLVLACQDHTPLQPEPELAPSPALAQAPNGAGDVVKMVPYKGKGTWWVAGVDYEQCGGEVGLLSFLMGGDFTGPLIGHAQASWTNCYTSAMELVSQTGTITTANGDLLYFYSVAAEHGTRAIFYPDNTWELGPTLFNGGTGRFEHAQGWIVCSGTNNDELTEGTMTSEGWISSVGSSK